MPVVTSTFESTMLELSTRMEPAHGQVTTAGSQLPVIIVS